MRKSKSTKCRSFLKWAGGKYSLVEKIQQHLPEGKMLIEPFVGAGSVFLNTDYKKYLLNDINADLINLFQQLKDKDGHLIYDMRQYFSGQYNNADSFYEIRDKFNQTTDPYTRSVYFLYLNRHCYNGLCRYNLSGGFNVPFGRYVSPYFPEEELEFFVEKAQKAEFTCTSYTETFKRARKGSVIYCDPPYVPLSKTASFTTYAKNGFGLDEQENLVKLAEKTARRKGIAVLISNHATEWTETNYGRNAREIDIVNVARTISHKGGSRKPVREIFALY